MSTKPNFWEPLKIGDLTLKNRILMSPMTRDRTTPDLVPTGRDVDPSMVVYYEQRASAGEIRDVVLGCRKVRSRAGWRSCALTIHLSQNVA